MTELLDPTPDFPDDTPIAGIQFPTRIRNVLANQGLTTVGDVRDASDKTLMALPDLGLRSIAYLRATLGRRYHEHAG